MSAGAVWTAIGLYCLIGVIVLGIIYWRAKHRQKVVLDNLYPLWAKAVGLFFLIIGWPLVVIRLWQQQ